ncbi:hypothetical protein HPE56_04355 [Maribacter sp. ANRC-HE7]|uniref:Beta-lactamase-inhibitor-like PepSY-like domain-containing protein n=1 Tax=Maribacter aquimaris TaxID=2737171 RepID=A0ABR7V1J9_9FLAO|nr:hypothetical protein [Maribacter aquimaris]MBD0777018.1 hypothetical protein [Maribacter aquimaris]
MKKLVLATAFVLGGLSLGTASTPFFHDGIMEEVLLQDYTEIAASEVPEAITTALEEAYPDVTLVKAYKNGEEQYKLEVSSEDGSTTELYADAEGNWIEM